MLQFHRDCNKYQPHCKAFNYNIGVTLMTFGKWLLERRREKGLTQGELARRANISTSYVSTLERSEPHSITNTSPQPTAEVVESIAKALGVETDEARLAAGYAARNGSSTNIDISDDVRLILLGKDISPEDREEYERAVSLAVAMAKQRIEEKNKNK
jgi:transcriptional regulator with XRE-family HTH domain